MMYPCVVSVSFGWIIESMVGQTNDKQIVPNRSFAYTLYELSEAMVGKSKSIWLLFLQPVIGYFKRFVTAQSKKSGMPGGVSSVFQHLIEMIEGYIIVDSPSVLVLTHGEIGISGQFLISTFQQIAFHIGKINITAI